MKFKNKYLPTIKYCMTQNLIVTISMTVTVLINILIGFIIRLSLANQYGGFENTSGGGSTDIIVIIHALIMGMVYFGSGFKLAIENGASRKTYFKSMMIVILMTSFIWSIISYMFVLLGQLSGAYDLFSIMYGKITIASVIWYCFAMCSLMTFGLLIAVIMRRTTFKGKMIIFPSIVIIGAIFTLIDVLCSYKITAAVGKLFANILGLTADKGGQFIAASFFLVLAIIFSGFIFLLIRRAEIK